ncbi:MAG: family 16 glycosylhydrolase [Henriciella sp.]
MTWTQASHFFDSEQSVTAKTSGFVFACLIVMALYFGPYRALHTEPEIDSTDVRVAEASAPEHSLPIVGKATKPPVEDVAVTPTLVSPNAVYADLRNPIDPNVFFAANHANDGAMTQYAGPFLPENHVQTDAYLALMVKARSRPQRPTMAEMKSHARYGYGRYETIMRPSGEPGVVSAFFTYTGPWFGTPHDEVDIEFTGNRPSDIEFNYFKSGVRGAYARKDLGFDASAQMHLYAFDWLEDKIIWYVDGQEIYRTPVDRKDIPTHESKIFISAWAGADRVRAWTGPLQFGAEAQAEFECISFTPVGDASRSCSDQWAERTHAVTH